MKTAHKVWMYFLITVVIWSVARLIPSVIYAFSGNSIFARAIFMLLFLPAGWYLSCKISKGRFSNCIKANLYIFCVIEGSGLLNLLPVIMELSMSTGQYSVDSYGIPYTDYPSIYGPSFLFVVVYLALGIYLTKKTTKADKYSQKENVKKFDFSKSFFPCALSTLCFWTLIFLGPVIILLINNIGYYFSGAGYGPGSIMYSVLQFLSQPLSCLIAASAADAISKNQHKICVIVNCSVCSFVCLLLAFVQYLDGNTLMLFTMIASAVSNICASYVLIKQIWEEQNGASVHRP